MHSQRMAPFKIIRMDSLGQGVSKETDKITFIPKTLPGDAGETEIVASRKGVSFGKVHRLASASPMRIQPVCPHFEVCPSCHYLHTSYEQEILFKEESLDNLFKKIPHPPIQVTKALRRTHYRNRIQLHYDLGRKLLGMLDAKNHTIAPIPKCLIGRDPILEKLKDLYFNDTWMRLAQSQAPQGHVEIYEFEGEVKVNWNKDYADGGFTQVFSEMNQLLKDKLTAWSQGQEAFDLLDIFAGNGNLSEKMNFAHRLCVDFYSTPLTDDFFNQDLYHEKALSRVKRKCENMKLKPSVIVLDPPRSGLSNLAAWLGEFQPQKVAYVSCDPHTMVRDIMPLKNYQMTELHLVDFFPSTFHFETMAFLERT